MKRLFLGFLCIFSIGMKAQYAEINHLLTLLEEKKNTQPLKNIKLEGRKFLLIKDFDDHTERNFLIFNENKATFIEVFDDKKTDETSSNIFDCDMIQTANGVISVRCDILEGKKISLPIVKNFLPFEQRKITYLKDINSQEKWIDEKNFTKNSKK